MTFTLRIPIYHSLPLVPVQQGMNGVGGLAPIIPAAIVSEASEIPTFPPAWLSHRPWAPAITGKPLTLPRFLADNGTWKAAPIDLQTQEGRMSLPTDPKALTEWLKEHHREPIKQELLPILRPRMPGSTEREIELKASSLAGMLINSVLPYVVEFLQAKHTAATTLTDAEQQEIKTRLKTKILQEQPSFARQDLLTTFEKFWARLAG